MKKLNKTVEFKQELTSVVKKSFDDMLNEVVKGKMSLSEFTNKLQYDYAQKRMELSGSIF